jgi:hypothetical protein
MKHLPSCLFKNYHGVMATSRCPHCSSKLEAVVAKLKWIFRVLFLGWFIWVTWILWRIT